MFTSRGCVFACMHACVRAVFTSTGRMEPWYSRLTTATVTVEMSWNCLLRGSRGAGSTEARAIGAADKTDINLHDVFINCVKRRRRNVTTISKSTRI